MLASTNLKWFVVNTFTEIQAIVEELSVGIALESSEKRINFDYSNLYSGRVSKALVVVAAVVPEVVVTGGVIVEDVIDVSVV